MSKFPTLLLLSLLVFFLVTTEATKKRKKKNKGEKPNIIVVSQPVMPYGGHGGHGGGPMGYGGGGPMGPMGPMGYGGGHHYGYHPYGRGDFGSSRLYGGMSGLSPGGFDGWANGLGGFGEMDFLGQRSLYGGFADYSRSMNGGYLVPIYLSGYGNGGVGGGGSEKGAFNLATIDGSNFGAGLVGSSATYKR